MSDLSGPMELFLGYDPGGKDKHGVVSVRVGRDGTYSDLDAKCLRDATQVKAWLCKHPTAVALGIDTLLAWSCSGARPCDDLLRERYNDSKSITFIDAKGCVHCENGLGELRRVQAKPEWRNSKSVVSQNSLYSAMTLNGALVAMAAREGRPEFPVVESHPKLLLRAAEGIGPARDHLVKGYSEALCHGKCHKTGEDGLGFTRTIWPTRSSPHGALHAGTSSNGRQTCMTSRQMRTTTSRQAEPCIHGRNRCQSPDRRAYLWSKTCES